MEEEITTDLYEETTMTSSHYEVTTEVTEAVAEAVIKRPPPGVKGIEAEDLQVRNKMKIIIYCRKGQFCGM